VAEIWVPEFEHVDINGPGGQSYEDDGPWKIELHMTQGDSIEGAEGAFRPYPPHGSSEYEGLKRHQYVPLDKAAYANLGIHADRSRVIQWEIVGHSENAAEFWPEELDWIGTDVLAPISRALLAATGTMPALTAAPAAGFHGPNEGIMPYLATPQSPIRFKNDAELDAYSGILGHQHMPPPDDHWDPGLLDTTRIVVAWAWALGQSPAQPAPITAPAQPGEPLPTPGWYAGRLLYNTHNPKALINGWDVGGAQQQLIFQGHGFATTVDGWFGYNTEFSTKSFQRERGLKDDGVIGPMTARALGG
jgi:peptidoglycan hydrolase-like protein with peptidoglycan-binding domain